MVDRAVEICDKRILLEQATIPSFPKNNLRVGPEDRVMGHDTFRINFVGSSLKIIH